MGPIVGIREFLSMLRRRGPIMAATFSVILVAAAHYAMSLSPSYEAVTVVQIEPSSLSATPGGDSAAETAARLRLVEQQLMARNNVVDMIERFGLFDDAPALTESDKVRLFRNGTRIDFIPGIAGVPGQERSLSAVMITVRTSDANTAANLANNMVDQVLTRNNETRNRRINDLVEALLREDGHFAGRIAAIRMGLQQYQAQNRGSLPENAPLLMAELTRYETRRVELGTALQELEREIVALTAANDTDGRRGSLAQQIRGLEVDLSLARRTLPENHPEIVRLEQQLASLREGEGTQLPPGIARQVEVLRDQVAALTVERTDVEARIPALETSIANLPAVAARIDEFEREIAALETDRAAVAVRLAAAQLDQRLINGDQGERLAVLEAATPPELPQDSGRRRIMVLAFAAATAAALGVGFLMELARPILRTPAQVRKALGVEPISFVAIRPDPRRAAAERSRMMLSGGILVMAAALVAAIRLL